MHPRLRCNPDSGLFAPAVSRINPGQIKPCCTSNECGNESCDSPPRPELATPQLGYHYLLWGERKNKLKTAKRVNKNELNVTGGLYCLRCAFGVLFSVRVEHTYAYFNANECLGTWNKLRMETVSSQLPTFVHANFISLCNLQKRAK